MSETNMGWRWFETKSPPNSPDPEGLEDDELPALAARCFRGENGDKLLAYLASITTERAYGPNVSDAMLRHTEGQRQLVAYIRALVQRGRSGGSQIHQ